MARRRYVSTTISQDTRINKLALKYGDFAALLYTWMIPHAADDATLPGDPEELLYQVIPGRRDKTEADVQAALDGMAELGLIVATQDGRIMFPTTAFYRYQTYIKDRNKHASDDAPTPPQNTAPQEDSTPRADNSAKQRKTAQKAVSFSPSPSFSLSPSPSPPDPTQTLSQGEVGVQGDGGENPKRRSRAAPAAPAPDIFPITAAMRSWAEKTCPEVDIDRETPRFLDKARAKGELYRDWTAAWRSWMTNPYPKAMRQPGGRAQAAPSRVWD